MSIPASLSALVGRWSGRNSLWLDPTAPADESDSTMNVTEVAGGRFVLLQYTWATNGAAQEGLLLIGENPEPARSLLHPHPSPLFHAVLVDSFHTGDDIMTFRGEAAGLEKVSVTGSYREPTGPEWGWQIDIETRPDGALRLAMFNITPEGVVYPAVEAVYLREG